MGAVAGGGRGLAGCGLFAGGPGGGGLFARLAGASTAALDGGGDGGGAGPHARSGGGRRAARGSKAAVWPTRACAPTSRHEHGGTAADDGEPRRPGPHARRPRQSRAMCPPPPGPPAMCPQPLTPCLRQPARPWGGLLSLKKHKNRIASHRIAGIFRIFAAINSTPMARNALYYRIIERAQHHDEPEPGPEPGPTPPEQTKTKKGK